MSSLGAILVGQVKRVHHCEVNSALPPLRMRDICSAIGSLFAAYIFLTWGIAASTYVSYYSTYINKWVFSPFCLFFAFMAAANHQYLRVKQDARQWVAIAVITVALWIYLAMVPSYDVASFSVWGLLLIIASVAAFSHYFVKIEFILKRRACSVFDVLEKFGVGHLILCMIGVLIDTIYQLSTGSNWTCGIYIKAVFSDAGSFFATLGMILVSGILHAIILAVIFNSSSLRLLTLLFMPFSIVSLC